MHVHLRLLSQQGLEDYGRMFVHSRASRKTKYLDAKQIATRITVTNEYAFSSIIHHTQSHAHIICNYIYNVPMTSNVCSIGMCIFHVD